MVNHDQPIDHERILNEVATGKAAIDSLAHSVDQLRQEIGATRSEISTLRAEVGEVKTNVAPHIELYADLRAVGRIGKFVRNTIIVVAGIVAGIVMTYQAVVFWISESHNHLPPGS